MDRGADLGRLRDLSKLYARKAHDLQALIKDLQAATSDSTGYWKGPKADRFRDDWHDVKPTFEKWVDTLNDASKSANTSADNIERAT
ncbi:WXG100 family type VII secretion target [Streptomyces sp. NPDC049915]|uniref:WXG100 family type VII secretion target n=1 Tax=Streptomyces sp. NPDC049915 TaxID=3155510 RepID=UPI003434BD74